MQTDFSVQIIGEVIMKWFHFYYFWFHQHLYVPVMPKNQNQKIYCAHAQFFFNGVQPIRNAAEIYNIFFINFFGWVNIWKIM